MIEASILYTNALSFGRGALGRGSAQFFKRLVRSVIRQTCIRFCRVL